MNTTYRISLDVHKIESQVSITTFRGDSGHKIVANLTEDGKPLPLSKNCTVNFEALKADNHKLINECYIENGKIVYEFKQNTPEGETCQATACPGIVKCQFKIIGENGRIISSPRFAIVVEEAVCDEGEIGDSVSEATALTELVATLNKKLENDEFRGEQGIQGIQGEKGNDGYTPVKGVDYYTEAEKDELVNEILSNFVDGNEVAY